MDFKAELQRGAMPTQPGMTYCIELPDGVIDWSLGAGGFGRQGFTVEFQRGAGGSADVAFITIGESQFPKRLFVRD